MLYSMKTILLAASVLATEAQAFEVNGYHSGMSRKEVQDMASATATVNDGGGLKDTLLAMFLDGSYMSFNFCDDKLV